MIPGWTEAALLEEIVVAPQRAFVPLPDLRVIERPGWFQIITPSFKNGGFNEVALAVLAEADADATIDATIAEYRRLGIAFRWSVVPGSKPDDLAERLASRGLSCNYVRGMARSTAIDASGGDEAIAIREIDETGIDLFTQVMAAGWEMDPAPLAAAHDHIFRQKERPQRLFLATYRGEPAAVASYVAFPRSAYLLGAVVLEKFRGAGLYRALVHARLHDAAARGLGIATSQARESTSAPVLERMGFDVICRYPVYFG
jgi:GNAT superfamily N-acetyltransferase